MSDRHADKRLPPDLDLIPFLTGLSAAKRRLFVAAMATEDGEALDGQWSVWAHDGQLAPPGDWATWVMMAGRGFGKTRAGAQWLVEQVDAGGALSIALVGASLEDARRVMVEGRSGLLAVAGPRVADWNPSLRLLRFTTGARATIFSGASPDLLRGPEHHLAWCDELAKWPRAGDCWEMLRLGLRLDHPLTGAGPRALVTTTPRSGPVLGDIMAEADTRVTRGRTRANPHLSPAWKARVERQYAGTRLGRQELDGELLPEAGALWTPELIARCRVASSSLPGQGPAMFPSRSREGPNLFPSRLREGLGEGLSQPGAGTPTSPPPTPPASGRGAAPATTFTRTLIAVDPPSGDGTCGIVACAHGSDGVAHVLADHSVTGRSPEGWAHAVADACALHGTDEVIAEGNQGGKMVRAVLLTARATLRVRLVTATTGKTTRAEPVAMLFEAGKVRLHGPMPDLEAQLLGMIAGGGYEGPGTSPDRADAMVWGVSEVMRGRAEARVRGV